MKKDADEKANNEVSFATDEQLSSLLSLLFVVAKIHLHFGLETTLHPAPPGDRRPKCFSLM